MGGMATARWRPHVFGARLCQLVVVELVRAQLHLSARLAALEDVIVRLGIQLAPLQHVVHGMGHGMGRGMGRGIVHYRDHVRLGIQLAPGASHGATHRARGSPGART